MRAFYEAARPIFQSWGRLLRLGVVCGPPLIAFADKVGAPQIVVGHSMSPTLNANPSARFLDIVWVNRLSGFGVGDVVLLIDPMHATRVRIIKRVADISPDENAVFVLGDNRDRSTDSRVFGWVPVALVEGTVSRVLFPPWRWGAQLDAPKRPSVIEVSAS